MADVDEEVKPQVVVVETTPRNSEYEVPPPPPPRRKKDICANVDCKACSIM